MWERFTRDHEQAIRASAAPKEPSARARMVTARLRQEDEQAATAGRKGLGRLRAGNRRSRNAAPKEPEGWRTGPARQEITRRADRKRRILGGLGILVAVAALLFALNPGAFLSRLPGGQGKGEAATRTSPAPLPAETGRPDGAPGEAPADTPTLARPFAGSPAERYADGAKGLVLPEAEAVGTLSKEQVTSALKLTRDFLVIANLEPATLRGERPTGAIALIEPRQEELTTLVNASLSKPDREHDPLRLFSRFDPNDVRLVGDTVKTRGRMTFKKGEEGSVHVHADYTFVYPLVKKADGSREVTRTIVRRVLETELYDPARFQVTPGKLTVRSYNVDIGNSACDVDDGFLHPAFSSGHPGTPAPSGPAVDPYDRSRDLDADANAGGKPGSRGECGTASRT
ncbi:hypothetical protein [Streptomyces sp. NPDC046261]|uniref:hypothetical protein n=1 Tax=Streptomyces sp. NPDC046261 TaxID=3157200 RepID=UPI0033C26FED